MVRPGFELLDATNPELTPSRDRAVAMDQLRLARCVGASRAQRESILEAVATHPDVALRRCRPGHLTGSALVVDASATRTLLMHHAKLRRWFQPGGHADGDTNLAAVALREATEETGITGLRLVLPAIDADRHRVEPPTEDPHDHFDLRFLVMAPPGSLEVANEESLELRWVTEQEANMLVPALDESTRRLIEVGLQVARELIAGPTQQ